MAKKVEKVVKLQIPAGKATPAPPVGPALGQAGINIMGFTKEFNARTADQAGMIIPVVISVYEDKSFDFVTKTPPASCKASNIVTSYPILARSPAQVSPEGPEPITATFLPFFSVGISGDTLFSLAQSATNLSSLPIDIASPLIPLIH